MTKKATIKMDLTRKAGIALGSTVKVLTKLGLMPKELISLPELILIQKVTM